MNTAQLERALQYRFSQPANLLQALTHCSFGSLHNERLEFLGDSVLNCVIASALFDRFSSVREGDLSRLRANLVRQESLHLIAQRLDLGNYLRLGEGELKSGGHRRPSILADALEAIFGAIFLEAGFEPARAVILQLYEPFLAETDPRRPSKDPKTTLQEYLQGRRLALPKYELCATRGQAHDQQFEVECRIAELDVTARGVGASRRAAEQEAARVAYEKVNRNGS